MADGIQITDGKDISRADGTDFVVNSELKTGMKLHDIFTFKSGGERTLISSGSGLFAFIQRQAHGLGYVPAYIAFRGYGDMSAPTSITMTFNNFINTGGASDFANVDGMNVVVGFDEVAGADFIKVIVFAERLDS